jgi:acetolactate synthase-1/2/3 large subunit
VSYGDLGLRSWSDERAQPRSSDLLVAGDPLAGVEALVAALRPRVRAADAQQRAQQVEARVQGLRQRHREYVATRMNEAPISPTRLVCEVWDAVRDTDWLLLLRNTHSWPEDVWQFRGAGDYLGHSGGAGVGYGPGAMVGGALAARDSGRFPVGIIGDGDFLMAAGALWTAVHYEIPMLVVVNDNGSFYNDEEHQQRIARRRGRPVENAGIGTRITDPPVRIGDLARSYGCWATDPIDDPADLAKLLEEARRQTLAGEVAVVHVHTSPT